MNPRHGGHEVCAAFCLTKSVLRGPTEGILMLDAHGSSTVHHLCEKEASHGGLAACSRKSPAVAAEGQAQPSSLSIPNPVHIISHLYRLCYDQMAVVVPWKIKAKGTCPWPCAEALLPSRTAT